MMPALERRGPRRPAHDERHQSRAGGCIQRAPADTVVRAKEKAPTELVDARSAFRRPHNPSITQEVYVRKDPPDVARLARLIMRQVSSYMAMIGALANLPT